MTKSLNESVAGKTLKNPGVSLGCALAITISWSCYHSVLWAIGHGICSWLFVIWWCICGTFPVK